MTKFKSALTSQNVVVTPTGTTTKFIYAIEALSNTAPNEFYRTAGGLQEQNFGVTPNLGTQLSSVIVRGGILHINCALLSTAVDSVIVQVELRRAKQQTRDAADAAAGNTLTNWLNSVTTPAKGLTYTLDDAPDRQEYLSRALLNKTMVLLPGQMMNIEHRLKIEKWDTAEFERGSRNFIWIVYVSQVTDGAVAAESINVNYGHDLSFVASADAI